MKRFLAFLALLTLQPQLLYAPKARPKKKRVIKNTYYKKTRYPEKILLGKINPAENKYYIKVDTEYLLNSKRTIYLCKEAYTAFKKMFKAALKQGIRLKILSGLRTFSHQKRIWDNKWNTIRKTKKHLDPIDVSREVLFYSAMPGTSRHHWGTDIDFNSVNTNYFTHGYGKRIYDWLKKHAHEYGFVQTYQKKTPRGEPGRTTGYEWEPWHWSYMPTARYCLRHYKRTITHKDLTGFKGSSESEDLNIFEDYVLSIDKE